MSIWDHRHCLPFWRKTPEEFRVLLMAAELKKNRILIVSFEHIYEDFFYFMIFKISEKDCFKHLSLFYCIFTHNKCEICCGVNHSTLLHYKHRVGILTVTKGPSHSYNILTTLKSITSGILHYKFHVPAD